MNALLRFVFIQPTARLFGCCLLANLVCNSSLCLNGPFANGRNILQNPHVREQQMMSTYHRGRLHICTSKCSDKSKLDIQLAYAGRKGYRKFI